jgi:hypothetical protein
MQASAVAGLTNSAKFEEFGSVRIYCSLFQNFKKRLKSAKKYVKKTRLNSEVTGEEIFIKPSRLGW